MPTLATIRNLQARIIYAQRDGNHAEVLRLKKGTGEPEVTKKVKGNPQLLLRVPPDLQKPLADESAKTGETRQGVLWRIAAKYFKGRKA